MAQYAQFILYRLVPRDDKVAKMPLDHRTLQPFAAGSNWQQDPAAWTTRDNAAALAELCGDGYGVGFLFTPTDPFFFLDIDDCLQADNTWSPVAHDLLARLPGAAVEVSLSGQGLHVFGRYAGPEPPHACKNIPYGLELYTSSRFAALTGFNAVGSADADCTAGLAGAIATYFPDRGHEDGVEWADTPVEGYTGPEDDDELIQRALASRSAGSAFSGGGGFASLWNADETALSERYPDTKGNRPFNASSADAALAQHLAFWTGKNCERIRTLMWRSQLVRDKWHREDYLYRTILRAVGLQEAVYSVDQSPVDEPAEAPKLRGTPKQIEYAARIRAEKIAAAPDLAETLMTEHGPAVDARFWIDRKDETPQDIAEAARPVSAPSDPLGTSSEPELTAGYQFLGATQQIEHFRGCVYVQDAHRVFTPSGSMLKPDQFNATYGGYVFEIADGGKPTRKAWEAFTESQIVRYPKAESTCFRPSDQPGALIRRDGRVLVNTYVPIETPRQPGDVTPFLDHLARILPIQRDRDIIMAYMAACVQHKGVKFQWAPLLQGVEGNGKTLFTRCVAAAIGERYVHMPPATEISEKFNDWLFNKLFIGVEDIYIPEQKRAIIEILKPMITNERYARRAMQQSQVMADLVANFMFNSNHRDAVRKTENDRRFAVFYTAQQHACDLVRDGMADGYFPSLYAWLRGGGYAAVTDYLTRYSIPDELNPATSCDRAPRTSSTDQAIAESLGRVEQEILEAVEEDRPGFVFPWVNSMALDRLLKSIKMDKAIPPNKRRELLKDLGYDWHPGLKQGRVNNPIPGESGKPRLFIKSGHLLADLTGGSEIIDHYLKTQELPAAGTVAAKFGGA